VISALAEEDDDGDDGDGDEDGDDDEDEDGFGDTLLLLSPGRGVSVPLAQPASRPPTNNVASRVNRRVPMAVGRYRLPAGSVDNGSTGVIRP
jgi:hypothetical protein